MTDSSPVQCEPMKEAQHQAKSDISHMALYNLSRAHSVIASLHDKPRWTNADTSSFDCMHYDGDAALEHCASKLSLKADERVLDIGSGFSATGRFLASRYGAHVTGIELQPENHELAQFITRRNVDPRVVERVRSVQADFLTLTPESLALFALHMLYLPVRSGTLFRQATKFLKPGGHLYIEDFFDKSCRGDSPSRLTQKEVDQLQNIVACPYLPSKSRFITEVETAGFVCVDFEDVSETWTQIVRARSENYKSSDEPNAALQIFYATVAELFQGNLGGVRLTAVRK